MRSAVVKGQVEVLCHCERWSEHYQVGGSNGELTSHRWKTRWLTHRGASSRQKAHYKVNGKSFAIEGVVYRGIGRWRHAGTQEACRDPFCTPRPKGWGNDQVAGNSFKLEPWR